MIIHAAQIPSKGWKSGLPETFEMRPFGPKQFPLFAKAFEEKEMRYLVQDALTDVLDIDIGKLSIPDAMALVLHQRMEVSKVAPLILSWKCHKPIFMYPSGPSIEQKDEQVIGAEPCDTLNQSTIQNSAIQILELGSHSEEFDLPRMVNYEFAQESTFNWVVAHMGPDFLLNIDKLNASDGMELWARLIEWARQAKHGVMPNVSVRCAECSRQTNASWTIDPSIFMV